MVTHRRFDDHNHLNISSRLQRCIAQRSGHRLPTRAVLHQIRHRGVSPFGEAYAEVKVIDPSGQQHRALATEQHFGDLEKLKALEGQEVGLRPTLHGLQLLPPGQDVAMAGDRSPASGGDDHPDLLESVMPQGGGSSRASLEEVVSAVARISRDLNLPTACWIHLP